MTTLLTAAKETNFSLQSGAQCIIGLANKKGEHQKGLDAILEYLCALCFQSFRNSRDCRTLSIQMLSVLF